MFGCMITIEAIKLLTGYGKSLLSKIVLFNIKLRDKIAEVRGCEFSQTK